MSTPVGLASTAAPPAVTPYLDAFILKVASRCNLNCSYCYVYNRGDSGWRGRPAFMSDEVFDAAITRVRRHCVSGGQDKAKLVFHGGEPCLVGSRRFDRLCDRASTALADLVDLDLTLQTNGTLIDEAWAEVLAKWGVTVGLSLDGPKDIHDSVRVTRSGRGSYDAVRSGLTVLLDAGIPVSILAVIPLGADPLEIHHHLLGLGSKTISYLLPDYSHDTVPAVRDRFGTSPCADFLLPIFDEWWSAQDLTVRIDPLWHIARAILGGGSLIDYLGNKPLSYVFVETDGGISGLDVLGVCRDGLSATGLNVHADDFRDIMDAGDLHRRVVFTGMPIPAACGGCAERETCGGGYLPHRFSRARGFDNPSVWCADMLRLFGHMRECMAVSHAETARRRAALAGAASPAEGP